MIVAELIEILKELPQDAPVVMASDGEGNSFSPCWKATAGFWPSSAQWGGEFYRNEEEAGEDIKGTVTAVCLWPVG